MYNSYRLKQIYDNINFEIKFKFLRLQSVMLNYELLREGCTNQTELHYIQNLYPRTDSEILIETIALKFFTGYRN